MAIAGLLVHVLKDAAGRVDDLIKEIPGMTTYGCHQDEYIVVVAEAPAEGLEKAVEPIEAIDGVLTIYTTYVTVEDEADDFSKDAGETDAATP